MDSNFDKAPDAFFSCSDESLNSVALNSAGREEVNQTDEPASSSSFTRYRTEATGGLTLSSSSDESEVTASKWNRVDDWDTSFTSTGSLLLTDESMDFDDNGKKTPVDLDIDEVNGFMIVIAELMKHTYVCLLFAKYITENKIIYSNISV